MEIEDKDYEVCYKCGGHIFRECIAGTQKWNSKTGETEDLDIEVSEHIGKRCQNEDCGETIEEDEFITRQEWEVKNEITKTN